MCLTADPGVANLILARSHTFMEIDHKINFYAHSPPFRWFKKGCCQSQAKVGAWSTGYNRLVKLAQEKSVVRWTDHPDMTIDVEWDIKYQTKPKKNWNNSKYLSKRSLKSVYHWLHFHCFNKAPFVWSILLFKRVWMRAEVKLVKSWYN